MDRALTRQSGRVVAVAGTVLALTVTVWGSMQKPVTQSTTATETFTVEAIDYDGRLVTLKDADGFVEIVAVGPEVKRLNEIKVGDTITFRYYESLVYAIRKPGQAAPSSSGMPTTTRGTGPKPGGTVAQQVTASVVITALDPKVPSVTVRTDEGRTMSFKVDDPNNLVGVKVGDRVDITYTQAVAIAVESPK